MVDRLVLIAGGGIAGLALKRALRQRGVRATLADPKPPATGGGLAIHLTGNAIAALGLLGLSENIAQVGRPIGRREYRTDTGRLLFESDEEAFWGHGRAPRLVRRADLLQVLEEPDDLEASRRLASVKSVRLEPEGSVVGLDDGRVEQCDLVVGADGVHSVVRSEVFGDEGRRTARLSMASWRGMAPNPGVKCLTIWSGSRGAVALIPLSDDEAYFYASSVKGGPVGADPSWLSETFRDFAGPVPEVVAGLTADPAQLYHSPITEVRIPAWSRGRSVLIGDAAHATAPVWAVGAGLAIEDALVLAAVLTDADWDRAGTTYERRRRARVDHVTKMTDLVSRGAGAPPWIRRILLPRSYRATYQELRRPV